MLGILEQLADRPRLHHVPAVHHRDEVGHVRDHAGIMRDDDQPHAVFALEPDQEVEDLRLHRDVQRRGGLVGDDQGRAAHERHGDHRALAEPARQLERVRVHLALRVREPDRLEGLDRRRARRAWRLSCRCRRPTSPIWLPIVWTGENAVIGSWKIMEIAPPRIARIWRPSAARVARSTGTPPSSEKRMTPRLDPGPRGQDPHDGLGQDALAGPRLPDDRHGLARGRP